MDKQNIISQINGLLQSSAAAECIIVLELLSHMLRKGGAAE